MKNIFKATLVLLLITGSITARENVRSNKSSGPSGPNRTFAGCQKAKARADLDINNIRTPVLMNGDMWWDLVNAGYEVPKGSNLHSLFSGAIWIGGKDNPANGQLKVAAQTYRQSGEDFWPGPMDTANTSVSADVCAAYDRHWKVSKAEVKAFVE
ncbi:MAG: hypothetical protein ACKOQ6_00540, partial [Bacteroidota bacterium]